MSKINQAGLDILKSFEKCRLKAYDDGGGIWTVGWGSVGPGIEEGTVWTQQEANRRLEADLLEFEEGLTDAIKVKVTDNQFSAMVVMAYNIGLHAIVNSTLMKMVNAGKFTDAASQFDKWTRQNGKVLPGLVRRRAAERQLFETV